MHTMVGLRRLLREVGISLMCGQVVLMPMVYQSYFFVL